LKKKQFASIVRINKHYTQNGTEFGVLNLLHKYHKGHSGLATYWVKLLTVSVVPLPSRKVIVYLAEPSDLFQLVHKHPSISVFPTVVQQAVVSI